METRTVLLIDLSALFRAAWHANADGPTSVAFEATLGAVRRCQSLVGDSPLVAVCCDGRGNWRKELSPEYKQHREKQPEAMYGLLGRVKEQLTRDGYLLWSCDGYEADDLIAGATKAARAAGHDVVIATHDKDIAQLVSEHVKMLKTSTWEMLGPAEIEAKFGVPPSKMVDYLALVGDASDGVKGIPSVGPKTAATLIKLHGGLVGIYQKVGQLQTFDSPTGPFVETKTDPARAIGTPAVVDKLWRHKADAALAAELVSLKDDAPINFEAIYEERKVMTTKNTSNTNLDAISEEGAAESDGPKPQGAVADAGASSSAGDVGSASAGAADASPAAEPVAVSPAAATAHSNGESKALVVSPVYAEYQHGLEPRTGQQALTLGEVLFESRAYSRFPTAQAITATVMRGRELGIPALASLDAFHFVAELGRILPSWQVIRALAEKDPKCKYIRWVSGDDKSATWEARHADHPEPTRLTYKIEQAVLAGLVKPDKPKSAWIARPEEQLSKTCCCILARRVFSGAVLGLYSRDEMGVDDE